RRSCGHLKPCSTRRQTIECSALTRFLHSHAQGNFTMTRRRWASLGFVSLAISLATAPASAQLATGGGADGGSLAATGFSGLSNSGGYSASVPLDLPPA